VFECWWNGLTGSRLPISPLLAGDHSVVTVLSIGASHACYRESSRHNDGAERRPAIPQLLVWRRLPGASHDQKIGQTRFYAPRDVRGDFGRLRVAGSAAACDSIFA
jgi:hypothetical protein